MIGERGDKVKGKSERREFSCFFYVFVCDNIKIMFIFVAEFIF